MRMSIKCPHCHSLVATDAASGAPPEYCPYCDGPMAHAGADPDATPEHTTTVDTGDDVDADNPDIGTDAPVAVAVDNAMDPEGDVAADNHGDPLSPAAAPAPGRTVVAEDPTAAADRNAAPAGTAPEDEAATAAAGPDTSPGTAPAKPLKRVAPSFARRLARAPKRATPRRLWALVAGLALLAAVQIVLADRARLAADARWRPLLVSLCAVVHCTLPPWREPTAFIMLGRNVRQHPYMPGALRVDATFRNNARWPQPWPELVLTLSDVDGRALGMRTFSPQEYLGKVTQKEIASGQSAAIRMEVMEPAPGVVSFSFDFR
jgi:hypothetical protein